MGIKKNLKKIMKKTSLGRSILDKRHARYDAKLEEQRLAKIKAIHDEALAYVGDADRDHVWAFVSGQASQDFRGNPKYMFVYINRYRKDIKAYWLCNDDETVEQIRSLGFHAYNEDSTIAQKLINKTGVYVAEQVKFAWPQGFTDVKYLNLWHGVGFKKIERKLFQGDIAMGLARKYVMRGTYYRDYMLMTASCPDIFNEYTIDCGVDKDHFIHAGYVRNLYQQNFEPIVSYDHDLKRRKGLSEDAKLVVYAPTYRAELGGTFAKAIPDFDRLYDFCEKHNYLFIFKMHPNMEKEEGFIKAAEKYGDKPHFLFWDNRDDFYEIMDKMDLAIVDYSGIISDMLAMGVPHYIRYDFDFDEYMNTVDVHGNYMEKTTGIMAYSFDELLKYMEDFESRDEAEEIKRVNDLLWCYSEGKDDFEKIIKATFDFKPVKRQYKTLYSFDIFDTLFTRKVLDPIGVFFRVKEKMEKDGTFPFALVEKYPSIRHTAEFNVREYYSKSLDLRDDDRVEISFDEIFDRIATVYGISEHQIELLKKWELETELDNVIPLDEQISLIKKLKSDPMNEVVLVSDMYLSKEFVTELLQKADPYLTELPLFLSNEYGVLKTSQQLFFEVYKSFEPFYDFEKWIHYGDNLKADQTAARNFKINTRKIIKPEFNDFQQGIVDDFRSYDSYLVAAMQARMCSEYNFQDDEFVISYIALCFVPYIDWVLRDAERRGYKVLYFVTRDGHHLKRIADAIIRARGLDFETRLIYASRRTWRIPSYIDDIDHGFWETYGNFNDLVSKDKLFSAMNLSEEKFRELFPVIDPDTIDFSNKQEIEALVGMFKISEPYKKYLLKIAAEERAVVEAYTKQEMDFNDKYAIVEFYGRGYNQDCFRHLVADICGTVADETEVPFYYYRSVLPTANGSIRHNFTTNDTKPYFIEAIFANMPYKSIEKYEKVGDRYEPVIKPISYNAARYESMNELLPEFARRYAELPLERPEDMDHLLCEFVFEYYLSHRDDPYFAEKIGSMVDSVSLYGNKREFAPPYTMNNLKQFQNGTPRGRMTITSSITMSYIRADKKVQEKYDTMYQIMPGDNVAGNSLLSADEQKANADYKKKNEAARKRANSFKTLYESALNIVDIVVDDNGMENEIVSVRPIENKIVLVSNSKREYESPLVMVKDKLEADPICEVKYINLSLPNEEKPTDEELALELATAKIVIMQTSIPMFSGIKYRDETKVIMLRESAFPVYNQGLSVNYKLKWRKKMVFDNNQCDLDVIQVPGEGVKQFFLKNYCSGRDVAMDLQGNCNTDLYFDDSRKNEVKDKISKYIPDSVGKKLIFYMPTPRFRSGCKTWLNMIDMEVLKNLIGKDYYVIISFNNLVAADKYENVVDVPGFCKLIDESVVTPREYMSVCDVIIGDYRDTFFESAVLDKPVFFTASDFETIIKNPNMTNISRMYDKCIFGPVISNAYELAEQLKKVSDYDYEPMRRFRKEMFEYCDGHSTSRIVDYLKNIIQNS